MRIQIERIRSTDRRTTSQLATDEVVSHEVDININGNTRTFTAYVKAHVLPLMDASLVYGDELLEELLRFEPAALNVVYRCVGKVRRGETVPLPILLLDTDREGTTPDVPSSP